MGHNFLIIFPNFALDIHQGFIASHYSELVL